MENKTLINGLPMDQPTMADGTPYGLSFEERQAFRANKQPAKVDKDPMYWNADGSKKTYAERVKYRQLIQEGKDKVAKAKEEARIAALEAVPEHLRRPKNYPAIVLAERLQNDRPGNRCPTSTIEGLKKAAAKRELEIDQLMADKLTAFKKANCPKIKAAVEAAQIALKSAIDPTEVDARTILLAIAEENPDLFWKESSKLYEQRLQKLEEQKTQHAIETAEVLATDAKLDEQIIEANKGKVAS